MQLKEITNPYWDEYVRLSLSPGFREPKQLRQQLVCRYALALTSPRALQSIVDFAFGQDIVEIGAGSGYWKFCLEQMGLSVASYDNSPVESGANPYFTRESRPWSQVLPGGPEAVAQFPDRMLFLCWPPANNAMASSALSLHQGNRLVYIGEPRGGPRTGDRAFHDRLARHWKLIRKVDIPRWTAHNDALFLYERARTSGRCGKG